MGEILAFWPVGGTGFQAPLPGDFSTEGLPSKAWNVNGQFVLDVQSRGGELEVKRTREGPWEPVDAKGCVVIEAEDGESGPMWDELRRAMVMEYDGEENITGYVMEECIVEDNLQQEGDDDDGEGRAWRDNPPAE